MRNIIKFLIILFFVLNSKSFAAENTAKFLETDWTFKGLFGKFDRASLQRG